MARGSGGARRTDGGAVGQASSSRRGRRPGAVIVREEILTAATTLFGAHGYQAATMRMIGELAGVDPKLVHYYFGSKEDLFGAVISEVFRARGLPDLLTGLLDAGEPSPGTKYLLGVITALDDPGLGPAFIGIVRGLGTHDESRRIFTRFIEGELIARVVPTLSTDAAPLRVALAGSQLLGVVMARYVLRIPHLVELDPREFARLVGPTIDRYLTAEF